MGYVDSWVASTGSSWVEPHSGTYAAGITIGDSPAPTVDDYLIMPQQSIVTGNTVSLYARNTFLMSSYVFKIMISTNGGTAPSDFTETLGTYTATGGFGGSWLYINEDLSSYNDQDIYIAIYAYTGVYEAPSELLIDDVILPDGSTEGFEDTTTTIGAVDVTVNCNDIHGNTNYGVDNRNGVGTVDATQNWWGDTSGPTHSSNSGGIGDTVSDNVDYDPWLTELAYSGVTTFANTEDVILQATLHNSDNGAECGEVSFYIDGSYTNSNTIYSSGVATLNVGIMPVGVYEIRAVSGCLETSALIAVYDPSAGFVTGGGWIDSPPGAFIADDTLSGKANFGFVSKYKKGADTPTGTTQFQFKVADLKFHSDNYDWLVIAGEHAKYKGTGTINGEGEYGFMLTATDGDFLGTSGIDKFRIKIWDKTTETVVYDNKPDDDDTEYDGTELGGGSIVIHKAKK